MYDDLGFTEINVLGRRSRSVEERLGRLEKDPNWTTIKLPVTEAPEQLEEILVERVQKDFLRLEVSPMLVLGLAADDVISLDPESVEGYRLVSRGKHVAIHLFLEDDASEDDTKEIVSLMESVGGRLDGTLHRRGFCFTFPPTVAFAEIERVAQEATESVPGTWSYSNVYDPKDGTPLNWWKEERPDRRIRNAFSATVVLAVLGFLGWALGIIDFG